MKKIVFVSEQVVKVDNYGVYRGQELNVFVQRYRQYGMLSVFCYAIPCKPLENEPVVVGEYVSIHILDKPNTIRNRFFRNSYYTSQMSAIIRDCDLVICHLPSYIGNKAIRLAEQYKKPYVVGCVGCIWDSLSNYNWKGKLLAPYEFLLMKRNVLKAPYVFYVTHKFLQRRYPTKGEYISCSNVYVHHNPQSVLEQKQDFLRRDSFEMILLTTAAVDVRYKGQDCVIKAIAKLRKKGCICHYYLAGGGNPAYLKNIAIKYGVEDLVHFLGYLNRAHLSNYFTETDIYIQPSKQEGLPRALIEAMNAACPALGTNIAGIPELLPEQCLFRAGNVDELVEKIETCSIDKRLEMAHRNFYSAQQYDNEILTARRDAFFKRILLI